MQSLVTHPQGPTVVTCAAMVQTTSVTMELNEANGMLQSGVQQIHSHHNWHSFRRCSGIETKRNEGIATKVTGGSKSPHIAGYRCCGLSSDVWTFCGGQFNLIVDWSHTP